MLFLQNLLAQFYGETFAIKIFCDSMPSIAVASRQGVGKIRHLETRFLWLQDLIQTGRIQIEKCASLYNKADLLTKQLLPKKLEQAVAAVGLSREASDSLAENPRAGLRIKEQKQIHKVDITTELVLLVRSANLVRR